MEQRRHGRETWAQFDDPISDQSSREPIRIGDDSFNDSTISHHPSRIGKHVPAEHVSPFVPSRVTTDPPYATVLPNAPAIVASVSPFAQKPTGSSVFGTTPSTLTSQLISESISPRTAELWSISSEQRAYYLSQFLRLQSDPRAKLSGPQAKMFFELSKLPTSELSYIWELSDVDRDGQLTLGEFAVAMHLVVLRRNGVPVPRTLPETLMDVIINQSMSTSAPISSAPPDQADQDAKPHRPSAMAACTSANSYTALDRRPDPSMITLPIASARPWPGSPTCSSAVMTPGSGRQRRWSISSQSDISSLAEGIIHFEAKPNADSHLQHPIPVRARTLPMGGYSASETIQHPNHQYTLDPTPPLFPTKPEDTTGHITPPNDFAHLTAGQEPSFPLPPSPPPPPPRAYAAGRIWGNSTGAVNTHHAGPTEIEAKVRPDNDAPEARTDHLDGDVVVDLNRLTDLMAAQGPEVVITQLQQACDEVMQTNDQLASELMQLQQHRIALKILLERLMPLEAAGCPC